MTKPYYQDEFVTLYHADSLKNPELWACADVLITDPPYGMHYASGYTRGRAGNTIEGDESTGARDAALAAWGHRPALVAGRWNITPPGTPRHVLIWSKGADPGMGDLKFPWGNSYETIAVYGQGWQGVRGPAVLEYTKPAVNGRSHPTPKPVPLMEALIRKAPPGVIADPFAGSGSTLVAAKALGRKVIGVELEETYCRITAERCAQEVLDLWGGAPHGE